MGGKNNAGTAVHSGKLLHRDGIAEDIKPGPAVLLRIGNPHKSHFSQLFYRFRRKFIVLIQHKSDWLHFAFCKSPHFLSECFMLLCCLIKHICYPLFIKWIISDSIHLLPAVRQIYV